MHKTSRRTKRPTKSSNPKRWLLVLVVIALVSLLLLEVTNTTHLFHKRKVPAVIPSVSGKSNNDNSSTSNQQPNNSPTGSNTSTSPPSKTPSSTGGSEANGLNLVAPYGDFVSNHHPGASDAPVTETSTCNTTVGASCYIKFTNTANGKTSQLATQTVGSDGSTTWNWSADILTSGNWQITAVATLNNQTKSTNDTNYLVVQ